MSPTPIEIVSLIVSGAAMGMSVTCFVLIMIFGRRPKAMEGKDG